MGKANIKTKGQSQVAKRRLKGAALCAWRSALSRSLLTTTPMLVVCLDRAGRIIEWNRQAERTTGRKRAEVIGASGVRLFIPPASRSSVCAVRDRVLGGRPVRNFESPLLTADGGLRIVLWNSAPLRGPDGRVVAMLSLGIDVTDRKEAEERAVRQQASQRALLQATPDMIFRLSADGTYLDFAPSYAKEPLPPPSRFIGRRVSKVLPRGVALLMMKCIKATLATGQPQTMDYALQFPPDNKPRHYIARLAVSGPGEVVCVVRNVTNRKQAADRLSAYQEQLRSMASQLALAEERERRRIAGELHDRIGQNLALGKIRLHMLAESAPPQLAEALSELGGLLDQTIEDTRSLTFELSPPVLYELGFKAAAEWLIERIRKHGLRAELACDRRFKSLDEDVRVLLFQGLRELLVNVVKHAGAESVHVVGAREGRAARLSVRDDGRGFDPSAVCGGVSGFGLFSLRERFERIGGRVEIDSAPGRGACVSLLAPLRIRSKAGRNKWAAR